MAEELPENFVYSIAASPAFAQDGTCFAAQQSGLYRSVDGGSTWQNAYATLAQAEALVTHAVAVSPDFAHDRTVFAAVQGGVLRSTDGGEHWQVDLLTSPPPVAAGLVASPNFAVDGQAFCATIEDGVFITRDRGTRWATWNFGLIDLQTLCLAVSPQYSQDETLIAGAESGIFRSKNGGRAWKIVDFPVDSAPVTSLAFSNAYANETSVLAGSMHGGLYRSKDQGSHWELLHSFAEGVDQILLGKNFASKPEIMVLAGSAIHYSANLGQSWVKRRIKVPVDDALTCLAAPDGINPGSKILAGTFSQGVILI
jgi:photosystem II stability/assembly factor-like uncharacterized protein